MLIDVPILKVQQQRRTLKPINVINISYSSPENSVPYSYAQRECNEFVKLELQGISVLVGSGNDSVAAGVQG